MAQSSFKTAFRASLPVAFGYVPIGIAFGILFVKQGYHWIFSMLMGGLVYAGASQFMALALLGSGAGIAEIAFLTLVLNSRHIFFGLSLLRNFAQVGLKKLYLIFGLTDETYSLITCTEVPSHVRKTDFYFSVTALNHFYWTLGCTLGGLLGAQIQFDTTGMDFAMTGLFIVLLIEQIKNIKRPLPFAVAAISAVVCILLFGKNNMLLPALILTTGIFLGWQRVYEKSA